MVQPIFESKLFSEGGHAEIWLSNDDNRILLQMKSKVSFGSLNLYIKSYRPSPTTSASAESRAEADPPLTPREADLSAVRTIPVARRPNKVQASEFAHPPAGDRSFAAFLAALPDVLVARDFRAVVDAIVNAARRSRGVVLMLGGHVVKTGLAPLIIDLMRRGVVTHVAMNGSAAIHDYEIARFGATSEDVVGGPARRHVRHGRRDRARDERGVLDRHARGQGMGESLGSRARAETDLAHPELSVMLAAFRANVPVTVHAALGAEIIHQHPAADGAAIGDTSHRDFRRLAASLDDIDDGGVVLNLGSAVIMPEVFLKALTIARNLNDGHPRGFVTRRPRHAAALPSAHERRAAPDARQRSRLRDHGAPRDHGAAARVGGRGRIVARVDAGRFRLNKKRRTRLVRRSLCPIGAGWEAPDQQQRSARRSRPSFAQSTRGFRTDDANDEVDQQAGTKRDLKRDEQAAT